MRRSSLSFVVAQAAPLGDTRYSCDGRGNTGGVAAPGSCRLSWCYSSRLSREATTSGLPLVWISKDPKKPECRCRKSLVSAS